MHAAARVLSEAVGPDVTILIDVWRGADPSKAIRVAKMLEELDIFWYEEPVPSENLDLLAEVSHDQEGLTQTVGELHLVLIGGLGRSGKKSLFAFDVPSILPSGRVKGRWSRGKASGRAGKIELSKATKREKRKKHRWGDS